MQVSSQAESEPKLGVVFEQRVRPRRPASLSVFCPRGGGQVAAVDRRAAGGIGDGDAVPEQLGQQFQVRGFATSGAGPGEFEQRLQELGATDGTEVHVAAVVERDGLEELDRFLLLVTFQHRLQIDGAPVRLPCGLHRTGFDTQSTARAVLGIDLQRVAGLR